MPLHAGSRIGPYEIAAEIGAGGMGIVYRAQDTKLGRDVALKVLPDLFADDPERLARFQREAKVLASLNHPNIASIYGLEEADGVRALVLELVEGPTLAELIAARTGRAPVAAATSESARRGAAPSGGGAPRGLEMDEALAIARQIAEALEAAHEAGVIHRDLKPANVKVKADGLVKVLDFGLAKALEPELSETDTGNSPTMTAAASLMGAIMGTAAYMSPEQARGTVTDRRADIWSFGVVLYEMLTGKPLFTGATVSDTLAAVLRADPDWKALPAETPSAVRRLLRRSLERDRRRRLPHAGDARLEIDEPPEQPTVRSKESKAGRAWGVALVTGLISAAVAATLALRLGVPLPEPKSVTRFSINTASGESLAAPSPLVLSPDGRRLIYNVGLRDQETGSRLYLHSLDSFTPRHLEGAENPAMPFFSPRGDSIGFLSRPGGLQQLRLSGGAATLLVDVRDMYGSSWGEGGVLVFSPNWGEPLRVLRLDDDSETRTLTTLDADAGELGHVWPQILPRGRAVLFSIWTGAPSWDEAWLAVADLETGQHRVIYEGGAYARYVASGHLVFWRGGALMAVPFDLDAPEVGEPVNVIEGVRLNSNVGGAHFALSDTGTLAYVPGGLDAFAESFVIDRAGQELLRLDETEAVGHPAFSPDGGKVALTLLQAGTYEIGVYDLERGVLDRITYRDDNLRPTWTADGARLTYQSNADGSYNYYSMNADGSGEPERLLSSGQEFSNSTPAWSPDGEHLVYAASSEETGSDLWIVSPGQEPDPRPLIDSPAEESSPRFSPDGRFIVYQSAQSGATDIVVRPFPDVDDRQWRVAAGRQPVWSGDGREILYVTDDGISRVTVDADAESTSLSLGRSSPLVDMPGLDSFDISQNGESLAINRLPVESAAREIRIVLNWFEELKRLVPTP